MIWRVSVHARFLPTDLNAFHLSYFWKDSFYHLVDVFPELPDQVQTHLRASSQLETHLSRISFLTTFQGFTTSSNGNKIKERIGAGAVRAVQHVFQ